MEKVHAAIFGVAFLESFTVNSVNFRGIKMHVNDKK
jgi:hypothetical protein